MIAYGKIHDYDGTTLTIKVPFNDVDKIIKANIDCEVRIDDGRTISAKQRSKIWAMIGDICKFNGHDKEFMEELLKMHYLANTGDNWFSLKTVDMTTARLFIEYIIEFCLEQHIPMSEPLLTKTSDIRRFVYGCLMNKVCCICGKKTQIHHVDQVGMGRNRKEIIHTGMRVLSLCGGVKGHHKEAHNIGRDTFLAKYHLEPVEADDKICNLYKMRGVKDVKID